MAQPLDVDISDVLVGNVTVDHANDKSRNKDHITNEFL